MRLTLRSMLAYLDEILEPADAAVIEEKIKESEFATGLMHRIRDVTRKLRLAAPKVEGPGMGLDPNTVSEYLDNTLPSERVPDFERVCLESDVHLAEVAASHQILALVLGEPAEVHPDSRQKMYRLLAAQANSVALKEGGNGERSRVDAPPGRPQRKRPEVPAYLREPNDAMPIWRWAAAAVLLIIVCGVAVLAIGPQRIRTLLATAPEADNAPAAAAPDSPDRAAPPEPAQPLPDESVAPSDQAPPPGSDAVANADDAGGVDLRVPTDATNSDTDTANGDGPPPIAPLPPSDVAIPADNAIVDPVIDPVSGDNAAVADGGSASDAPPENADLQGIGRFFSEKDVLLTADAAGQEWRRLPARALLFPGQRLLALPTYRPSIDFSVGARLELLGDSLIELLEPDAEGVPGLGVIHGRAVLMTTAKPDTRLRLRLGQSEGIITFGHAASTLAIDVRTVHSEGVNPETDPGTLAVDLYAITGDVSWQPDASTEPIVLRAPARWDGSAATAAQPQSIETPPAWITRGELTFRENGANLFVEQNLPTDRPVSLSLRELAESRREEVRSLAARSLALIGEFGPFVSVLSDRNQKSAWRFEIDNLRQAMWRSRQTAAQVRDAFERQRGAEDGPALFRLLWGYNEEQIADGAAGQLLDLLDHDDLDYRVLAIWNLRRITGLNLPYYPDHAADERKRHIQRWRDKLQTGATAAAAAS